MAKFYGCINGLIGTNEKLIDMVMRKPIILLVFSLFVSCLHASDQLDSFKGLEWINLTLDVADEQLGIWYNPEISKVIHQDVKRDGWNYVDVLKTKIDAQKNTEYIIAFDQGPSFDPAFVFYRLHGEKQVRIGEVAGARLVVPGNGNIYVSGHVNTFFNMRKKFKLSQSGFQEVMQPFYYVGEKTKIANNIAIYSDKKQTQIIARLLKGTEVEILISEDDYYLIKTPLGLVGWFHMTETYHMGNYKDSPLQPIYYKGD